MICNDQCSSVRPAGRCKNIDVGSFLGRYQRYIDLQTIGDDNLLDLSLFVSVSITSTLCQGHSNTREVKLRVVSLFSLSSDRQI